MERDGADGRDVLVPRLLVSVVNGVVPRELGGDGRLRLCEVDRGRGTTFEKRTWSRLRSLVARAVQERLHRLPTHVLDHVLPPPPLVVRHAPVQERTRRSLTRPLLSPPPGGPWTVRRYLEIFKLKATGLVDLLGSLEVAPTAPVDARSGDRTIKVVLTELTRQLPIGESVAEAIILRHLASDGAGVPLSNFLALAESGGIALPFRRVRHGGTVMLVAPGDAAGVSACYTAAVRSMQSWGLASVKQIVRHVRVLHRHAIDNRIATAVLSSLPRFSWLDEKAGWFWFKDRPNRLVRALGKVFSVARRISLPDLLTAVLRSYGFRERPGRRVIQSACAQLPGFRVDGDWVTIDRVLDRDEWLSPTELSLVEMLEQTGGVASPSSLSRSAPAWGISLATLRLAICRSPVIIRAQGDLMLIGSSVAPA